METEIPEGWELKKLSEVAEIVTGSTPSTEIKKYYGGEYPWVRPPELGSISPIVKTTVQLSKEGAKKARLVPKDSILVCCIGSIGKIGIAGVELATNQQINSVVFDKNQINPKFGYYYLLSVSNKIEQLGSETTIKIVNKSRFSTMKIIKPPLSVQEKIVAKLDAFFEKYEKMKKENMANETATNFILKSSTDKLISGGIHLPTGWKEEKVAELVNDPKKDIVGGPFGSNLKTKDYTVSGVRIIRLQNIKPSYFDEKKQIFTSKEKAKELDRHSAIAGDLILAKLGEIGDTCELPKHIEHALVVADCVRIRPDTKKISKKYLMWALNSSYCKNCLRKGTKGTTRPRVNLKDVRNVFVPHPSILEQIAMAKKIEIINSKKNLIDGEIQKINNFIESLPKSILTKAFSGGLVS